MKKENTKYVEPSSYFTKEALKVFNDKKEDDKANNKKKDDQKKRENEELRKVFKGK